MANRDWIKNQSAGRLTTTNTAYQDALTATGTPTNGSKDFWVLASAIVDKDAATTDVQAKLIDSTGAADLCIWNIEPKDTTDRTAVFGLAKWTSPVSPVSQSFKLQYACETSGTAGIAEMSLNAIESHASDQYIGTDAETTTTSASAQDAQTLTFTPATAGDYLIVAYGEVNAAGTSLRARLDIDGATSHLVDAQDQTDTTNYAPWTAVRKVTLTAASHTIKIQFWSGNGTSVAIRRRRILAIRLDTLNANSTDYTSTRATTTSTTAVDAASTTFTAAGSVDYLAIGNVLIDGNSTTISTNAQLSMDGSVAALQTREMGDSTRERIYAAVNYNAFAAGSRTVKTQVFSETALITTGYSERGIYVLDIRQSGYSLTVDSGAFTLTGGNNTLLKASKIIPDSGSFTFTGQNLALNHGYKLAIDSGSFTFSGQDVDLIYTPNTGYTLAVDNGAFSFTGGDMSFRRTLMMPMANGAFTFAGQDVALNRGFILSMSGEVFTTDGQATGLYAGRLLAAANGSFALTGQDISYAKGYLFSLASGTFNFTGDDIGLTRGLVIPLESGDFNLTGQSLSMNHGYILLSNGGSYNFTGGDVDYKYYLDLFVQMQGASEIEFDAPDLITALSASLEGRSEAVFNLRRPISYNEEQKFIGNRVIAEFRA